jgi:hypothetical protein
MKNLYVTFAHISTLIALFCAPLAYAADTGKFDNLDYDRARWHPIHFQPAINEATNEDCLACHQEILDNKVKEESPAGVKASESLAWYQTLGVYEGEQETFHARHLTTPIAKELMNLQCNFCHQGNDPREEAPANLDTNATGFTLRKMVDPEETCLLCHGKHNSEIMGLPPGTWKDVGPMFGDSCTAACHVAIRTTRHQVTYLNADAIEEAAAKDPDTCYGCHGGRQWYRITYPYPRHAWPGAGDVVPDWALDRPTQSHERFRLTEVTEEVTEKVTEEDK